MAEDTYNHLHAVCAAMCNLHQDAWHLIFFRVALQTSFTFCIKLKAFSAHWSAELSDYVKLKLDSSLLACRAS